ncbi:MAG: tRNA (adenosine(37)-N6)-threonylcarbamoyltransferase complex dimerization subunit type 1 TsaB [Lachnospiraceae bacterium]|nr:tRNA (adenosine(37)-N6)-threonylcarbamoyltransferase complex dimerization subunit type 1 TsaB [Lachnospiraceae bacterium]
MKLIALDSSGLVASVAVIEDELLIAEYTIQYKKTHSQTLLPMLDEIKKMIDLDFTQIDAIAVAAGPGSFTGLRIGSATAKGLAFAINKPIVAVPTLDGLAYNLYGTDKIVCPIMDARRNQVYTGIYEFCKEEDKLGLHIIKEQCAVAFDEIAQKLNELGREVIFLGDGVPVFAERMKEIMQVSYSLAPAHMNRQRAACIGVLGSRYYKQGKVQKAEEHAPVYLRLSQAERERKEQEEKIQEEKEQETGR